MANTHHDEKCIEAMMRANLRHVPFYQEEHRILVNKLKESTCISYRTTRDNIPNGTTHFDLQIIDGICYVLYIELVRKERGRGHGRLLYRVIENFARDHDCAKVLLTPSGMTVDGKSRLEYMLSLGYRRVGDVEVEKVL